MIDDYAGSTETPGATRAGLVVGSLIRTPQGDIPVENLSPGDLVCTHDNGPQPVCAVQLFRVQAHDQLAPICIMAGTLGPHDTLFLSPQHRVLIRDSLADMLFGDAEVLVAAKDLVNGRSVRRCADGPVDYVQLVLDAMQVIYVQGVPTECPVIIAASQPQAHGQAAPRRTLRPFEARILMTAAA